MVEIIKMPRLIAMFLLSFSPSVFSYQETTCNFDSTKLNQHFLLTTPRSGTTLMSFYLESLTLKPIIMIGNHLSKTRYDLNPLNLNLNYLKKPLYRSHFGTVLSPLNFKGNKLLFVLRNYKENVRRNTLKRQPLSESLLDEFKKNKRFFSWYIDNLKAFDNWDPEYRLLIYYEDLILSPLEVLTKILLFLDEPIPSILNCAFLTETSQRILKFYNSNHKPSGGSHSEGLDLEFHSNQIPFKILRQIDEFMEETYPDLWEAYLKHYKSIDS